MSIIIKHDSREEKIPIGKKSNLLDIINSTDIDFNAPCGGNQKCGKCLIKIISPNVEISDDEKRVLGSNYKKGFRLACFNKAVKDMVIEIPKASTSKKIMINSNLEIEKMDPVVKIEQLNLEKQGIHTQCADVDLIMDKYSKNNIEFLKEISKTIRDKDYKINVIKFHDEIIGLSNSDGNVYGVAVDIGTTTVAAYLCNLNTGEIEKVESDLNAQKKYGADVISRIQYASKDEESLKEINNSIITQINSLLDRLVQNISDIYVINLVGNTTMTHLVMGIDPVNIGVSPFIPTTNSLHSFNAKDLNININNYGICNILPNVSGYVGSDIIAGVIATKMHKSEDICLLLDIGTNGEIVLGNKDKMVACATAAGPAFEGANIHFGVGGIKGAIETVEIKDNEVVFTTIDKENPVGICGSGIVDTISELLKNDIVDETGRFYDEDEFDIDEKLLNRITEFDNKVSFLISDGIYITQKDVREIQNAKAAIAGGIITLVSKYGIKYEDIKHVYLAGGFGSYMDVKSAIKIGLIPKELENKVISSGNTAGAGAIISLLSQDELVASEDLKESIEYVELSSDPEFTNNYIECMMFE